MKFLKVVHRYLLTGAIVGVYFSLSRLSTTAVPFCIYVLLTGFLSILFVRNNSNRLFTNLVVLFVLQLLSIKLTTISYLLSIGFGLFISFSIGSNPGRELIICFSTADFSAAAEGQRQTVGINLFSVVMLLLLTLTKEKY